jgi:hypothetical protein
MTKNDIATRIREALYELEGGHDDKADEMLNAIVADLEAEPAVRLNEPEPLRPNAISEEAKFEVTNGGGEWTVFYFADATNRVYDGDGGGDSLEDACREAMENAK